MDHRYTCGKPKKRCIAFYNYIFNSNRSRSVVNVLVLFVFLYFWYALLLYIRCRDLLFFLFSCVIFCILIFFFDFWWSTYVEFVKPGPMRLFDLLRVLVSCGVF